MARYRTVNICLVCKKIYRSDFWPDVCGSIHRPVCPHCGTANSMRDITAKPKLFGIRGWQLSKSSAMLLRHCEDAVAAQIGMKKRRKHDSNESTKKTESK